MIEWLADICEKIKKGAGEMTKKKSIDLEKKAQKILGMAEEQGAEKNFLFITTFQRYWMQINILSELEGVIAESDMLVKIGRAHV